MPEYIPAAIYARVSDKKKQGKNYSLPTQVEACQKLANERGYTVAPDAIFRETFTGTELARPEMDKVRSLARQGIIKRLLVLDIDRLGRDMIDQLLMEDEFKGCGVTVDFALADYDNSTEGQLQKH